LFQGKIVARHGFFPPGHLPVIRSPVANEYARLFWGRVKKSFLILGGDERIEEEALSFIEGMGVFIFTKHAHGQLLV
jgi:hypothetical protein